MKIDETIHNVDSTDSFTDKNIHESNNLKETNEIEYTIDSTSSFSDKSLHEFNDVIEKKT